MPQAVHRVRSREHRASGDILGRTPFSARCAVIRRNAWCCVIATFFSLAGVRAAPATSENQGDRPDAGAVVSAYLTLVGWVRDLDPPAPDTNAARTPIEGATGVCVILRHRGRVLGTGVDATADDLMVRRASGRATGQALGHRTVAGLPETMRATLGTQLTVELEVAGPLTPLPGRSFAQIAAQLDPGLDGVAMRRGDDVAWLFPAQMHAAGTAGDLSRVLPSLAVDLGLPATSLGDLSARFGARVYRFATIHLAQPGPGKMPFETIRGQKIVPRSAVTPESIRLFAERITDHLITSLWGHDEPLGLMGDYDIIADKHEPLVAGPRDQALAALALARCATAASWPDDVAARMRDAAIVILVELSAVAEGESRPLDDPAACAAIVYAADALGPAGRSPTIDALAAEAARRVMSALAPPPPPPDTRLPSPHTRAMLAAAGARLMMHPDGPEATLVRAAIDAAWAAVPTHERVSLLPWLGWAELDYAAALDAPLLRADDLRALRAALDRTRLDPATSPSPDNVPADLAGGFDLSETGRPAATAQTARPAAFLASILRVEALTPPEARTAEIERHRLTMRFLLQLAVTDSARWAIRTPQRARGGVRAAVWSMNQPVAAQAMALLTAAETLKSLDALDRPEEKP